MRKLPEKFQGAYVGFKTDEEAWKISKILEECGCEWADSDRPGDGKEDWNHIRIFKGCNKEKNFYITRCGREDGTDFTAQEFFEEMEEGTTKLKAGDRVKHRVFGKGTVRCTHKDYVCIDRDDGEGFGGCGGSWHTSYLSWDLVKEEQSKSAKRPETIADFYKRAVQLRDHFAAYPTFTSSLTYKPMDEEKTVLQKIKDACTPEPQKTLKKHKVLDADGDLTHEGTAYTFDFLVRKFGDEMKEELDKLDKKKKKKKA